MKNLILTVLSLSSLAGVANAQGQLTYASGLEHAPVGSATLGPVQGRRLPVHNLGSSGQDGVEVKFRSRWGGLVGVDYGPSLSTGQPIRIRDKGGDGSIYGRFQIGPSSTGAGAAVLTADYSSMGAIGVRAIRYGDNGTVVSDTTTSGPSVDYVIPPTCPDGSPGVIWYFHMLVPGSNPARYVDQFVWSCAVGLNLHGDPYPGYRLVPILPPGAPGEPRGIESMLVTSAAPELTIERDGLATYSYEISAVGQGHVGEVCDDGNDTCGSDERRIRVTNLGSSGLDGVDINLGDNVGGVSVEMAKGNCCRGHVTLMKLYDDTGSEQRIIRSNIDIASDGTTTDYLEADFSAYGAAGYVVTCYNPGGTVIGQPQAHINGGPRPIWTSRCPFGQRELWDNIGTPANPVWHFVGCVGFASGTDRIVFPSGVAYDNVASFTLSPLGMQHPTSGRLRHVVITKNGSEMELKRVTTTPPAPTCGTADFNGDGDIGTDQDIEAFFRCLAGSCCTSCFSGGADFNADGDIGTDQDIESFFRVLAGAAC